MPIDPELEAFVSELTAAGESDAVINAAIDQWEAERATKPPAAPAGKSISGFAQNVGKDIGNIASSLMPWKWPGMIAEGGAGQAAAGEQFKTDVEGLMRGERAGVGLDPHPMATAANVGQGAVGQLYEQPVTTALALNPTGAATAARSAVGATGRAMRAGGSAALEAAGRSPGIVSGVTTLAGAGPGIMAGNMPAALAGGMVGFERGPAMAARLGEAGRRLRGPVPQPGARVVPRNPPPALESELVSALEELRVPETAPRTPEAVRVPPASPAGGGYTVPPELPPAPAAPRPKRPPPTPPAPAAATSSPQQKIEAELASRINPRSGVERTGMEAKLAEDVKAKTAEGVRPSKSKGFKFSPGDNRRMMDTFGTADADAIIADIGYGPFETWLEAGRNKSWAEKYSAAVKTKQAREAGKK